MSVCTRDVSQTSNIADIATVADPGNAADQLRPRRRSNCLAAWLSTDSHARWPAPRRRGYTPYITHVSARRGYGPIRLRCLEYERSRRRRVERCISEHLKCDPVQVRLPLTLQGEAASQVLGADYILQHRITVYSEAENDKGLPEDRVLRVKRKNLQRQVMPLSLSSETLKLLIHDRLTTDPAFQDRFIEHHG